MTYLQRKKLAFMSIVNRIKGFVKTVSGIPPLTLPDCVDTDSIINYSITGNGVGDYDESTGKYKIPVVCGQLLDYITYKRGYFIDASGDEIVDGGYKCTEDYIPVLPNTTYRIVCAGRAIASYSLTIPFYDSNKKFISRSSFGTFAEVPKVREFTTPNGCYYIRFSLPNAYVYNVSLYNLGNTTNIYLDEPLTEGKTLRNPIKLPTIKGTTIYSIDTAIQPSNMEVSYYSTSKE